MLKTEGNSGESQNIQDSTAGRDIIQAGRDVYVQNAQSKPDIPWSVRAGGPQFKINIGQRARELNCDFTISGASPMPGGIEARWVGAGIDMEWTTPMVQNVQRGANYQSYQMKAVEMQPTAKEETIAFEVRFNLEDGPHGGRWIWPMHKQGEEGNWVLDSHEGSSVFQPKVEDTW